MIHTFRASHPLSFPSLHRLVAPPSPCNPFAFVASWHLNKALRSKFRPFEISFAEPLSIKANETGIFPFHMVLATFHYKLNLVRLEINLVDL